MVPASEVRPLLSRFLGRHDSELNTLGWRITDPRSDHLVHAGHVRNLILLAEGLAALPRTHPQYDTLQFGGPGKGWWRWEGEAIVSHSGECMPPICDTASRALGHATRILREERLLGESWERYQARLFGPLSLDAEDYVFSCFWEELGYRHPHDVAERITDLVAYADSDRMCELSRHCVGMSRSY